MKNLHMVDGYKSPLSLRETQRAIKIIKDTYQVELAKALNLERITAPLFIKSNEGVNDDLNGIDRCVSFDIKEIATNAEIVQSLAKWKRIALKKYGFSAGEGIYTDMNAIRRDDTIDNIHSVFVDQWDWERVMLREERTVEFLQDVVRRIVNAMAVTMAKLIEKFPILKNPICNDVFFITSQELADLYPTLNAKAREKAIAKEHKTVFIMQIGEVLNSGEKHDDRAPDYDDWSLNGDILVWNDVLQEQLELSSMGIRVDSETLKYQLTKSGSLSKLKYGYHNDIINDRLPLTIGGGIGQSRLCMFMLGKMHIGEVQVSIWDEETTSKCATAGIEIL